ncbi:hypothetical protein AB0F96_26945 [Streptomyces sp. NPDC023998]|uniref:hypothetical protein n=1 Tax=Streptomyces sp. NPDC023998 TaxID=3154597 RepID=UPI0033CF1F93
MTTVHWSAGTRTYLEEAKKLTGDIDDPAQKALALTQITQTLYLKQIHTELSSLRAHLETISSTLAER